MKRKLWQNTQHFPCTSPSVQTGGVMCSTLCAQVVSIRPQDVCCHPGIRLCERWTVPSQDSPFGDEHQQLSRLWVLGCSFSRRRRPTTSALGVTAQDRRCLLPVPKCCPSFFFLEAEYYPVTSHLLFMHSSRWMNIWVFSHPGCKNNSATNGHWCAGLIFVSPFRVCSRAEQLGENTQVSLHTTVDVIADQEGVSLSRTFAAAGGRASSVIFGVDRRFDFVIFNAEDSAFHKHTVPRGRSVFRTLLETVENLILTPSQNSFNDFYESQTSNSNSNF